MIGFFKPNRDAQSKPFCFLDVMSNMEKGCYWQGIYHIASCNSFFLAYILHPFECILCYDGGGFGISFPFLSFTWEIFIEDIFNQSFRHSIILRVVNILHSHVLNWQPNTLVIVEVLFLDNSHCFA
jgi:hypothetical protein